MTRAEGGHGNFPRPCRTSHQDLASAPAQRKGHAPTKTIMKGTNINLGAILLPPAPTLHMGPLTTPAHLLIISPIS